MFKIFTIYPLSAELLFLFLAVGLSTRAWLGWMLQDLVYQTKILGLGRVHELVSLQSIVDKLENFVSC